MKTKLIISESDRTIFEKRCTESLIPFNILEGLAVKGSLKYELDIHSPYQLYYLGQQVMLDSFRKPVAFTEEQLTQHGSAQ